MPLTSARWSLLFTVCASLPLTAAWAATCEVKSGATILPVIELYTSEGCSSCPPADQWLSTLRGQPVLAQAFHVDYWNHIGWVDRFAAPAYTQRQRETAQLQHLPYVYTPQVKRDGADWRGWRSQTRLAAGGTPKAGITLVRLAGAERYVARVEPASSTVDWSAYWTVTENGHNSRVRAGENAGSFLQHDFVVRQYQAAGPLRGAQTLLLDAMPADAAHPRAINLVVTDPGTGAVWQAVSLQCDAGVTMTGGTAPSQRL